MSDETYQIIFQGRIKQNLSVEAVKIEFAKVFKLDSARVEKMFSGRPIVLRKGLSLEQTSKYEKAIQKAGAECLVLREQSKPVPVKAARAAEADQPVPSENMKPSIAGPVLKDQPGAGGAPPSTKERPVPRKRKDKPDPGEEASPGSGSDAGMMVVMTIGMLVMIGINMELLMSAGGGIIMSFVFSLALVLLTPTVIGLIIAAWFIGLVADLPTFALVLRTLAAVFVGCVVIVVLAYPLGLMKGEEKKDHDNTKSGKGNKV